MKKVIFRKIIFDINNFFLIILLSTSLIVWTIQAVNFLDFISEDGHGFKVYFYYTLLNFPKIISIILPFIYFISVFYILNKYELKNELLIFWTNGITKLNFAKILVYSSLIYLVLQIILTTIIVPSSQNLARSFIRSSSIDFFPSLIKEKKFIDTVENLTIFVNEKKNNGEMSNIFLKDKINDEKSQIIYAKTGKIISTNNKNFLVLNNGKIINIENQKTITLGFKETQFNLSKYTTKTTTWPKIQEHKTITLFNCIFKTINKIQKIKDHPYLKCDSDSYKDILQEFIKRIYLPFYIPVMSLIGCFLIIKSKESIKYTSFKILLFIIGTLFVILSQISIKYSGGSNSSLLIFFLMPVFIFYVIFNIFKSQVQKI